MSTKTFLAVITSEAKTFILSAIAEHYGITEQEAYEEVTDPEAEHLLDYMVGELRAATSVLMQKYGFSESGEQGEVVKEIEALQSKIKDLQDLSTKIYSKGWVRGCWSCDSLAKKYYKTFSDVGAYQKRLNDIFDANRNK